ncbi:hypothetical protein RRG08_005981 [Elysia crispata]|uniref:Uncharacterized protein n=1 Tax=Elysia crispata TaxID=231223 RepID=A0AAE0YPM7_9GAST|nr:hypothetical protein RRG08_005981 [Elysia crispata]
MRLFGNTVAPIAGHISLCLQGMRCNLGSPLSPEVILYSQGAPCGQLLKLALGSSRKSQERTSWSQITGGALSNLFWSFQTSPKVQEKLVSALHNACRSVSVTFGLGSPRQVGDGGHCEPLIYADIRERRRGPCVCVSIYRGNERRYGRALLALSRSTSLCSYKDYVGRLKKR